MFKDVDEIIKIFKEKNLKLTLQRLKVYSYLMSTNQHPTVDTIYKNVKKSIPTISLATVYKVLNTLVEKELVKSINVCEDNFRYDSNTNLHGHIKCQMCNQIKDINIEEEVIDIIMNKNLNINHFDLFLYGTCEDCANKCIQPPRVLGGYT